eukprot:scaffold155165_cov45-Prasinocladus_malaysianus.AAC.1
MAKAVISSEARWEASFHWPYPAFTPQCAAVSTTTSELRVEAMRPMGIDLPSPSCAFLELAFELARALCGRQSHLGVERLATCNWLGHQTERRGPLTTGMSVEASSGLTRLFQAGADTLAESKVVCTGMLANSRCGVGLSPLPADESAQSFRIFELTSKSANLFGQYSTVNKSGICAESAAVCTLFGIGSSSDAIRNVEWCQYLSSDDSGHAGGYVCVPDLSTALGCTLYMSGAEHRRPEDLSQHSRQAFRTDQPQLQWNLEEQQLSSGFSPSENMPSGSLHSTMVHFPAVKQACRILGIAQVTSLPLQAVIPDLESIQPGILRTISKVLMAEGRQAVIDSCNRSFLTPCTGEHTTVPRLARQQACPARSKRPVMLSHETSVIISGGLGAVGTLTACWLQHLSASAPVYLLARSANGSQLGLTRLPNVHMYQCDVSHVADSIADLRLKRSCSGRISFLHAAGMVADAIVSNQTAHHVRATFAPKVGGALKCLAALSGCAVESCVMYSSIAALLGSPGQASYAAANAALDGLMAELQSQGRCGVSVQWGGLSGGGMAVRDAGTAALLEKSGMGLIEPAEGLAALGTVLAAKHSGPSVLSVAAVFPEPAMHDVEHSMALSHKQSSGAVCDLPAVAGSIALEEMEIEILQIVHDALGHRNVGADTPFASAGMDSLVALGLQKSLEAALEVTVLPTDVFDFPSARQLAAELAARRTGPCVPHEVATLVRTGGSDVAQKLGVSVAAIAGYLPGGSQLQPEDGLDLSQPVPLERWDADDAFKTELLGARHAAFLCRDIAMFDTETFGVSSVEAVIMDPQHRQLLQVVADLGILQSAKNNTDTGVFVGIYTSEYAELAAFMGHDKSAHFATSSSISVAAGRLSFAYGCGGACVGLDTACSSASVATHMAAKSLHRAPESLGIAGSASLIVSGTKAAVLCQAGMLSPTGRCKPLDSSADGYARGEAIVCLALQAGETHNPLAVLLGTAVNQDGRSSSLTAPHGPSQQLVILNALEDAECQASAL